MSGCGDYDWFGPGKIPPAKIRPELLEILDRQSKFQEQFENQFYGKFEPGIEELKKENEILRALLKRAESMNSDYDLLMKSMREPITQSEPEVVNGRPVFKVGELYDVRGWVMRIRKVTAKDIIMRPTGQRSEEFEG